MNDLEQFVGVILPRLLGLVLVAYSLFLVHKVRRGFFVMVRGWLIAAFVVIVALLWIYETAMTLESRWDWDRHPSISIAFVVTASWLSVATVGMVTRYRRYQSATAFRRWVVREPANLIVIWGGIAAAILLLALIAGPDSEAEIGENTWLVMLVLVYLALSISLDIVMPVSAKRRGQLRALTPGELRGMVLLATAWLSIPTIEYVFDILVRGYWTDAPDAYDIGYSWAMVAMFVVLLRSVTGSRFSTLIVDAEVEMGEEGGFRSYDIPRGVYLFEEKSNQVAMDVFTDLVTRPLRPDVTIPGREESASDTLSYLIPRGLVVTREYPDRIRERHGLQVTPIIWLTESTGDRRIPPTSVALLTDTLIRYMESNPNSIVLIDGVEYLLTFNDFNRVVKALDSLNEVTWITRSRLIITLNPEALTGRELALMERDRRVVRSAEEAEELKRHSEKYSVA